MTTRVSVTSALGPKISPRMHAFCNTKNGATAVEFAITMPILVVLLLGIIEMSMLMFSTIMLDVGIRDAARYGMTGQGRNDPVARLREVERMILDGSEAYVDNIDFQIYRFPDGFGSMDIENLDPATAVQIASEEIDGSTVESVVNGDNPDEVVLYVVTADYQFLLLPEIVGLIEEVQLEFSFAFRNEPGE